MRNRFFVWEHQYTLYVFICVLFLVGVIFGTLVVNTLSLEQQQDLSQGLRNFFQEMNEGQLIVKAHGYWKNAFSHLKWLMIIFVCGLSVVGMPIVFMMIFCKGAFLGFTVGVLSNQYLMKGMLFALVGLVPQNLMIMPIIILISAISIKFSISIIKHRIIANRQVQIKPFLFFFIGTVTVTSLLLMAVSCFETWITPVMMQWVTPMLCT